MNEFKRFSEHQRIDQYLLRKKTTFGVKSNTLKTYDNILSNFPIGLIILTKEDSKYEDRIEFINKYACKLFKISETANIKELKDKFNEFIKLKRDNSIKCNTTLKDMIFNSFCSLNIGMDNFIPFESTYSKSIILYIKINEIDNDKYIVIDKYDKYIEERKYIEFNLIKAINYQYLHTLYHELNNPLNALLAISGENEKAQTLSSEISNSRIDRKNYIIPKKSAKTSKKINNFGLITLNNNKLRYKQDFLESKSKKRNLTENTDLNSKIPLLVNIIKIFIKNFILYLKMRADNLMMLKNEFDLQNETSDIMNAVEVSEYEKELTKHKLVKLNLEYILNLYFEKFLCLFKYKEIEYETNFEKLRNIFVITDEFNFVYYIREIYTYLYYIVPKKEGFIFDYIENEEDNTLKILVKKKYIENNEYIFKDNNKDNKSDMSQVIQTKEMTKEVLYSMSKRLHFSLEINDLDNMELHSNNINDVILTIILPIQKKALSEEEDEFKDEEINEMVQKDCFLLQDKLKRRFQSCEACEHKKSKLSSNNILDIISKNGIDISESSIYLQKKEKYLKIESINNNTENIKRHSDNNLNKLNIVKESQKKMLLLSNKSNDSFLNKCLISENKKEIKDNKEKDKERDIKYNKWRSEHVSKNTKIKPKIRNHRSDKTVSYNDILPKNEIEIKSQKLSGVFTKINNLGLCEELDINDFSIFNNTKNNSKNEKEVIKNQAKAREKKGSVNSIANLEMNEKTKNSSNIKTTNQDIKNSKIRNTDIIIEEIEKENKNSKKNSIKNTHNENPLHPLHKNNNIKTNLPHNNLNKKEPHLNLNANKKKKNQNTKIIAPKNCNLPEIEKQNKKRLSQDIAPIINPKECMTFFDDVSKGKKTILNENISQNDNLFIEANKERENNLKNNTNKKNVNKSKKKNNISNNENDEKEDEEESEESDESEENNDNLEKKSENLCNCVDILIVDDEEFNVMASQKMIQKLGIDSDVAYNGEECINLVKEKQKLNCQCNKNYYKIIFLDIVMPVLDGIKAAKKIQEMIDNKEINENIQIIFISGNIDGSKLEESLLQIKCVKECLQKPVRLEKYQKILEKYYKDI